MKIFQIIWLIFLSGSVYGQCVMPILSRESKKVKIGVDLFKVQTRLNRVDDLVNQYINDTTTMSFDVRELNTINQNVSSYLSQYLNNSNHFSFEALSLLKLNIEAIKNLPHELVSKISDDELFYCDGRIYLERNVVINFPVILDKEYNVIKADLDIIDKIPQNPISMCKAYARLKNLDSKISLLEVANVSIETSQKQVYLIFVLTDYHLTLFTDVDKHQYTQYYYQVNLLNGKVKFLKREESAEYSCG